MKKSNKTQYPYFGNQVSVSHFSRHLDACRRRRSKKNFGRKVYAVASGAFIIMLLVGTVGYIWLAVLLFLYGWLVYKKRWLEVD